LEKLKDQIAQKEKELELLKPKYEEMKKREEDCTREYVLNFSLHNFTLKF
jgi:structural maintenance of chromosome 3 (chondroitin sulfate proteoglycan 6)